jgi:hypothetical protein
MNDHNNINPIIKMNQVLGNIYTLNIFQLPRINTT